MIRVGAGERLRQVSVRLSGKDVVLGPDTETRILRQVVQKLSKSIDGNSMVLDEVPSFMLFSVVKQLAAMILKHKHNRGKSNG